MHLVPSRRAWNTSFNILVRQRVRVFTRSLRLFFSFSISPWHGALESRHFRSLDSGFRSRGFRDNGTSSAGPSGRER